MAPKYGFVSASMKSHISSPTISKATELDEFVLLYSKSSFIHQNITEIKVNVATVSRCPTDIWWKSRRFAISGSIRYDLNLSVLLLSQIRSFIKPQEQERDGALTGVWIRLFQKPIRITSSWNSEYHYKLPWEFPSDKKSLSSSIITSWQKRYCSCKLCRVASYNL